MNFYKSYRKASIRLHIIPILIWLIAVAGLAYIFSHRASKFDYSGIAHAMQIQITAAQDGRIKELPVQLYDKVQKGQILVIIDTIFDRTQYNTQLEAQKQVLLATIQQLQAQITATRDQITAEATQKDQDHINQYRRYAADVESARLQVLELKAEINPEKIRLNEVLLNTKIANLNLARAHILQPSAVPSQLSTSAGNQNNNEDKLGLFYELEKMKTETNTLAKQIEENEQLLKEAELNLQKAIERKNQYVQNKPIHHSIELALQPIREEINVQQKNLEQLMIDPLIVTVSSPFKCVINQILAQNGDAVTEGTHLLTILEAEPTHIVTYIREENIDQIYENMKVKIIKQSSPQKVALSYVTKMGPSFEIMPQQLWLDKQTPQWGRPVLIPIPADMSLIPGETVGIKNL